jgi:hypothetical protein
MLMPDAGMAADGSVGARVAQRWGAIDPLLPRPGTLLRTLPPGCGEEWIVAAADGRPGAVGTCEHWAGAAGSLDVTWGAARRFRLTAQVADPGAGGLDKLLSRWRDHLARLPEAGGQDTAAEVTWPSRDVGGVRALLRHGLAPLAVVAARASNRRLRPDPAGPAGDTARGAQVRRAGPADIDAVVRLGLETVRFDAHFGGVVERPETAAALRREAAGALTGTAPWVWLAEDAGTLAGMAWAERPEAAGWIAPLTSLAPAAYILLMGVAAGARGGGIGAALAARAHHEIEAAGVAVTLLHYALPSPLSVPFWSAQGYRPLWTVWEARPARTLR